MIIIFFLKARYQHFIGVSFFFFNGDYNKSNQYYTKAYNNYQKSNLFYQGSFSSGVTVNLGVNHYKKGKYQEAINSIKKGLSIPILNKHKYQRSIAYNWLIRPYEKSQQIDSAYKYLLKKKWLRYSSFL